MLRLFLIIVSVLALSTSHVSAQSSFPTPPPLEEAYCFPSEPPFFTLGEDVKVSQEQSLYERGTKARETNHWFREGCGKFYLNMPGWQNPDDEIYMITYRPESWSIDDAKAVVPHFLPSDTGLTGWTTTSDEKRDEFYHLAKCRDDSCFVVIYESVRPSEVIGDRHFFTVRIATTYDEAGRDCYSKCPKERDIPPR